MNRRPGVLTPVVLAVTLAGCASSTGATNSPGPAAPVSTAFVIRDYAFPALTASPGQHITIVDADGEPHTVTADDGSFDSGSFDAAAPGSVAAPSQPGVYPIHCTVHPSMHGTLTVR